MFFIMGSWKIIQRRTYDILSHKYSFVFLLLGFLTLTVSIIQFGEVWIEWNQSDSIFNSFSDNVRGKSLQKKLCQTLPIDVVYTWVNGSDPLLRRQIKDYQEQVQKETLRCQYKNCIASRFSALRGWIHHLRRLSNFKTILVSVKTSNKETQNWTLLEYKSPEEANLASQNYLRIGEENFTLYQAHWTSDSHAPNSYLVPNAAIVDGLPSYELSKLQRTTAALLGREVSIDILKVWMNPEKQTLVLEFTSPIACERFLQKGNRTLLNHKVVVTKAYLILKLPPPWDVKDIAPSRFEDKEELRYSLRSLEMYAPWVRRVYLVTNGQIPYWLNLDNPRLTVIIHEDIFLNHSHLPTFSSPAIESHLHRIPGLSQQFLYLNDDVFFGQEVWPDDFITHADGQKVYLSWAVPDCTESCPWSWIGDGSCDIVCNITECSFDGGDCNPETANAFMHDDAFYDDHHDGINDSPIEDTAVGDSHVLDWRDLTSLHGKAEESVDTTNTTLSVMYRETLVKQGMSTGSRVNKRETPLEDPMKSLFQKQTALLGNSSSHYSHKRLLSMHMNITENNVTEKKLIFFSKLSSNSTHKENILGKLNHDRNSSGTVHSVQETMTRKQHAKKISSSANRKWRSVHRVSKSTWSENFPVHLKSKDTFAESLLFVNQLYNKEFGFEIRKVPAHMPHLIDKTVMEVLQNRFPQEWERTSSHKIRSPHDMQYAFSYFYFLMSEKVNKTLSEIFDIFDRDQSGTWSDREIRTLLTQLIDGPLIYPKVRDYEERISNCSLHFEDESHIPTPPYERYQDSKLPIVSKNLIDNCVPVKQVLLDKFGSQKTYKTEIIKDKNRAVTFKMLSSNLSQLILMLDEIRREPKKFICLNDNLDPTLEKDNGIVRAVLQDFYESLFPLPSAFELPPEYRNRFLHMSELQAWRSGRAFLRNCIYVCLTLLFVTFMLLSFFQVEFCTFTQGRRRTRKVYQDV